MVKKVTITNFVGDEVEYLFEGVDVLNNNGLLITEIEGLGPVEADINFTELVTIDGGTYNSRHLNERNIVIHALFTWVKTIEDARQSSYEFFPIGKQLKFTIETNNRKAYTYGYVEKNEPDIFSPDCEMEISVLCGEPFLYDCNGETEQVFSNIEPLFEFVYENNLIFNSSSPQGYTSLHTEMGRFIKRRQNIVVYSGDNEAGCTFTFHAIGEVRNPTLYSVRTGEKIVIDTSKLQAKTGKGMIEGDDIILVTSPGRKKALLLRDGEYTNILNILGKNPEWPLLAKGENIFIYTADYGEEDLYIYVKVQAMYEGV